MYLKEPFVSSQPEFINKLIQSEYIFSPTTIFETQQHFFSIYSYGIYSFLYLSNQFPPELKTNIQGNQLVVRPVWWEELNSEQRIESRIITIPLPSHWFTKIIHSIFPITMENNLQYYTNEQKKSFQKIYFSCERTFLSWLNSANSPVTVGTFISTIPGGRLIGGIMILTGIIIVLYAIFSYISRIQKIELEDTKDKIKIYDIYGPIGLCLLIFSSWFISWLLIIHVL